MVQKLAVYKALAIVRRGGARKGMVKKARGATCTLPRLLPARGRCPQDSELLRRTGRPCTAGINPCPLSSMAQRARLPFERKSRHLADFADNRGGSSSSLPAPGESAGGAERCAACGTWRGVTAPVGGLQR